LSAGQGALLAGARSGGLHRAFAGVEGGGPSDPAPTTKAIETRATMSA